MSLRASVLAAWASILLATGVALVGCADGGEGMPRRDGGGVDASRLDSGGGGVDASRVDAPMAMVDSGRGMAATCEACTVDTDCADGFCAELASGGSACLPGCLIDLPDCPPRFECVANFTSSIPDPVCAPVGERCCVDEDGDLYGSGVGCLGMDCDETSTDINAAGTETCDGVDEDCDGTIDEGDPGALCLRGDHVATTVCDAGACVIGDCEPGFDDCNATASDGCETDIDTVTDCGGCGMACTLANVDIAGCDAATCTIALCTPGFGDCNGRASDGCEQPLDTNTHCGGCGIVCGLSNATSTCATGTCEVDACDRNWGDCDGRAMNGCETPLTTNTDCGTCGTLCEPAGGTGTCSTGTCRVTTCAGGYEDCNMSTADGCETSVRTLTNCGACGVPCTFANANASCAAGACTLVDCVAGYGNCDGITSNGCETRVNTLASCGACGIACAPAHATGTCSTGMCAISSCNTGWADCDGNVANGCETSLTTTTDCGSCGTACSRTNALADCATGTCRVGACFTGYGECDGIDATGCETPLRTTSDCGGCGIACMRANATPTCGSGTCAISSCNAGYANCDGIDTNGCETSLSALTSCGGCGIACTRANATADCSAGTCHIDFCNAGYANCDGIDANGCETPLTTLANCGACGASCALPNAGESCATGVCEITTCSTGYGDCDATDSNGCETSLRTLSDCGTCGVPCSRAGASATCVTGTCSISSCNPGSGNCDASDGNGCEASLSTLANCGACGAACDLANAGESCPSGSCILGACTAGYGNCDGTTGNGCETALTTLTNCGACGTSCALANASESCASGTCEITTCTSGYADCDATESNGCETSLRTLADCGACGSTCTRAGATATCSSGSCAISSCSSGFGNCDAVDANGCEAPLTSLTNCGGCGTSCDLPNATESCTTGTCTLGMCTAGFGNCDGSAANGCETPLNSLTNCGGCGVLCDLPGAGESCATGTCALSGCASGQGDCDGNTGNGCETSLTTLTNCGGCGTACSLAHASESCGTGTCAITTCDAGWGNCDGLAANGCETPLDTLTNCGACGTACNLANAAESCSTGTCTLGACSSGFGNCDGMSPNGCETALTSLANCGTCGTTCNLPNASESCSTGSCEVTTCTSGYANCDGTASNGCEVNTATSVANCGGCGLACSPANATGMCLAGSCAVASCAAGWGNCDGLPANGCETPLNTLANCSACGMTCDFPGASETCSTGTCTFGGCGSGLGNCDGNLTNGCETSLNSLSNCGGCGTACALANATESCSTGSCQITACSSGYGDCDGAAANGCEQQLNTLSHCAACGMSCSRANASATCASGSCAIAGCFAGYASCDGNDGNGCETNTVTDVTHCGSCATNCSTAPHPNATGVSCASSSCRVTTCSSNYFDKNQQFSDGCECAADSYGDNCGAANDMGTLAVSGSAARTANLVGTSGDEDWFRVTLTASASCSWRPRITLSAGSEPIVMRVYTACAGSSPSGGFSCGAAEGGTSAGNITTWEYNNSTTCGDLQSIDPSPDTGAFTTIPVTVWIRVFPTGSTLTCLPYTLTVTN